MRKNLGHRSQTKMSVLSKTLTCSCYELGHTWEPSCLKASRDIAIHGYWYSFKIYAPLYIAAALLRRRKKEEYLKKVLPEILRSSLFLGTNAFCFIAAFCVWRRLAGFYFFFNVFVCGIPAGAISFLIERKDRRLFGNFNFSNGAFVPAMTASYIAIILERKQRRGMLALYMFNLACETIFKMFVSRGYLTPIKYGETLLFSISTAGYLYFYRVPGGLKDGVRTAVRFLVGASEEGGANTQDSSMIDRLLNKTPPAVQNIIARCRQLPVHRLCKHSHSCVSSVLEKGLEMFCTGFAVQGLVKVLSALPSVFKKPRSVLNAIKHQENFQLGAFLGSFAAIYKAVSCLCRWVRDKDHQLHGLLAGFLAGWSMLFYRSSSIAMYVIVKLSEIIYFKGIASGCLPYVQWADVVIYTISTSLIFHATVFETHNLRPAYWSFLLKLTNGRFGQMNRALLDMYGTNATKMFKHFDPKLDPRYSELARKALAS